MSHTKDVNKLSRVELVVKAARHEIEAMGWEINEDFSDDGQLLHLELFKGGQRKGWGMFKPLYCWTEAYECITGYSWFDLMASTEDEYAKSLSYFMDLFGCSAKVARLYINDKPLKALSAYCNEKNLSGEELDQVFLSVVLLSRSDA